MPIRQTLMPFFVWDKDFDNTIEKIANGNDSEGHVILSHFVHNIESGMPPDPRAMQFVVKALKEVLFDFQDGNKVCFAKAFKMVKKKGRPPLSPNGEFERAYQYGGEVNQLMFSGISNKEAMTLVAEKYKISKKTVQNYYTLLNKIIDGFPLK